MPYVTTYESPLGKITMLSDGDALTGLFMPEQQDANFKMSDHIEKDDLHIFNMTRTYLDNYFIRRIDSPLPNIAFSGTSFQELVWAELLKIPYGETLTYGELAKRVAAKRGTTFMSARAIGHAVGQNPISIIVPCHRVIGVKQKLTGYGGGLHLKKKLLELEGHDLSKFKDK